MLNKISELQAAVQEAEEAQRTAESEMRQAEVERDEELSEISKRMEAALGPLQAELEQLQQSRTLGEHLRQGVAEERKQQANAQRAVRAKWATERDQGKDEIRKEVVRRKQEQRERREHIKQAKEALAISKLDMAHSVRDDAQEGRLQKVWERAAKLDAVKALHQRVYESRYVEPAVAKEVVTLENEYVLVANAHRLELDQSDSPPGGAMVVVPTQKKADWQLYF